MKAFRPPLEFRKLTDSRASPPARFLSPDDLRVEAIGVQGIIRNLTELLSHALGAGVQMIADVDGDVPPALAEKGQLETVLLSSATKARNAMPAGGTLTLRAAVGSRCGPRPRTRPICQAWRVR